LLSFGGEEGFKNSLTGLIVHSDACVGDLDARVSPVRFRKCRLTSAACSLEVRIDNVPPSDAIDTLALRQIFMERLHAAGC